MRQKAEDSLDRLRKMSLKKLRVPASKINEKSWTRVPLASLHYNDAIEYLNWLQKNTKGHYGRTLSSFWFEDEKDAFAFQLKFGSKGNQ
jgi:hypothetical protein